MLVSGTRLGVYEIVAAIGAGGMGEVYRARDTRLKRDVAIKILPETFATDPERLARFQREAEVLASLNHSNIGQIYGFEAGPAESGPHAQSALVLEFVDGETLAELIERGPIALDEALPIARQIAEALEAAHGHGIVHRDLKPANIKLRPDGTVKVLDFGLAKLSESATSIAAHSGHSMSPTITSPAMMTGVGVVLGTAAYMSPEQARGREADKRSDVWAFGGVYEMLTGRRPFEGEDVSDTFANVLKIDPDWTKLPAGLPATIVSLLKGCLEKNRSQRISDVAVVRFLLNPPAILGSSTAAAAGAVDVATPGRNRIGWRVAAAALVLAALAVASVWYLRPTPSPTPPLQATLLPPVGQAFSSEQGGYHFAVSPDGTKIAFAAFGLATRKVVLWVRPLGSTAAQPLAGTEGAAVPFWSPDSRSIAFYSRPNLKKIDAAGGPVTMLASIGEVNPQGGAWSSDGTIVFTRGSIGEGLYQVSAAGGPVTSLTRYQPGENIHRWPFLLPDGRHLLFQVQVTDPSGPNVNEIRVLDRQTMNQRVLMRSEGAAQFANGYLFYVQQGNLMAQPFDDSSLTTSGAPVAVAQGIESFTTGPSGLLAFQEAVAPTTELALHARDGKKIAQVGVPGLYNAISLSPDGSKVAASVIDLQTFKRDVWVFDVTRGTSARLTVGGQGANYPVWSHDGSRLLYWDGEGGGGIYSKAVSGLGTPQLVRKEGAPVAPNAISKNGELLAYMIAPAAANARLWIRELAPEKSDAGSSVARHELLGRVGTVFP
jgi:aminoglycoside phosphotransferase (APT) family kinase protein